LKKKHACALFSSKLAHDTQSVCFIAQLFRVYAIHNYFISMPTPAMVSVISQISNRWYFVSFGTMFLKFVPLAEHKSEEKCFLNTMYETMK